ncbi:MAG: acyltransferase [Lentisphaeria bacterium]|nr:acyltransferase [Lentisphaeria bacterium]
MKLKYYFQVNWLKTIWFNFKMLPFKSAVKLPAVIFFNTGTGSLKGKINITPPVSHAMIKIGRCEVSHYQTKTTTLSIDGTVNFAGKASFGRGSALEVRKNGVLSIGRKFRITAGTTIICEQKISIGDEFLSSWDNLIMDSDHHDIVDISGRVINPPCPVTIGNHVWLGCRTTLLKGCTLPDNCIVAAGSVLTRNFTQSNSVIGGCGREQTILRQDINWKE